MVEGSVGQEAHGDVAVEDGFDFSVFVDQEGLNVAAVDQVDAAIWFVMDGYDGDVFTPGDAGEEERVYGVECVDEGGAAFDLGVHHALDDGSEQSCGHSFAGDVGYDGDEAVVFFHGNDVVDVAAYLGAGNGPGH